ncbi:MAG TPA: hypothetical protein VND21_10055, partial [Planctomycetota bacterium]|nr:hypothetical protein [Planctomycetota bacterium]
MLPWLFIERLAIEREPDGATERAPLKPLPPYERPPPDDAKERLPENEPPERMPPPPPPID